jgi:signal transduction histidine kinase
MPGVKRFSENSGAAHHAGGLREGNLIARALRDRLRGMPNEYRRRVVSALLGVGLFLLLGQFAEGQSQTNSATPLPLVTNLQQLTRLMAGQQRAQVDLQLEFTVCAASSPKAGVLIAQDYSGVELLQLGDFGREIRPGERLLIRDWYSLIRKRDSGIELTIGPVADNDGMHMRRTWGGTIALKPGLYPVRLDWFNTLSSYNLEVSCLLSNEPFVLATNLWHEEIEKASGRPVLLPGLRAECYLGYWECAPNFGLLEPVKVGVVTNFDVDFKKRDEMVGIRYSGFFSAPSEGKYHFRVRSDDGSLLYIRKPEIPLVTIGFTNAPQPVADFRKWVVDSAEERRWLTIEGRVAYAARNGKSLGLELHSGSDAIWVIVADAAGLDASSMVNSKLRVAGVGRPVLAPGEQLRLGVVCAVGTNDLTVIERPMVLADDKVTLTTAAQVQSLSMEQARRGVPVKLRGVVTAVRNSPYGGWMSLQDETRGIFVRLGNRTNAMPAFRERWEVSGHSDAGDFAPVVIAEKVRLLGEGALPEPLHPAWRELVNGSRDVQWAELQGVVTAIASNKVTLVMPEGNLDVLMHSYYEAQLKPLLNSIVRIRGVLYALWNAENHEVRMGAVEMRNATINVDTPAPADPFDVAPKSLRELLMFDTQATAVRRVKVHGQIVYADQKRACLQENDIGIRLLPAGKMMVRAGDVVEAVGYPDLGQSGLILREAALRKTGVAPLIASKVLGDADYGEQALDSTRVRLEGLLLGWHLEQGALVLEMQTETHLYVARGDPRAAQTMSLRPGSMLALEGVFVVGNYGRVGKRGVDSFELLLNSPRDITVLSQPSWWTLQRLLIVVGVLVIVLTLTVVWITQLRRLVEVRTRQLHHEVLEREEAERMHALEAERTRIARDLHDDLGARLTEISILANRGQHPKAPAEGVPALFKTIADKVRGLITALDGIVWAVNPEDNSLQSVADYLSDFASEYLSLSNITCRFDVPVSLPATMLSGRLRHDLLLAVKESLNNIVRHAKATEVEFRIAVADGRLEIAISDNGRGVDLGLRRHGNGLKNLPVRLARIGGTYEIESAAGKGTQARIRLRLPVLSEARTEEPLE